MTTVQVAVKHASVITEKGRRWAKVYKNYDGTVYMDIGMVREDGVREVPHATRKYYLGMDGEVTFLTQVHS